MPPETSRSPAGSELRIGDRIVRPGLNRIDGPAGPVQVEPKVMEVLVHLAERRGEVISKEELVRVVWEGRFVSDDVVWRSIRELRRALGDTTCIETIPKRGYRLVEPAGLRQSPVAAELSPSRPHPLGPPLPSHTLPPGEGEVARSDVRGNLGGGFPLSRPAGGRWERGTEGVRSTEAPSSRSFDGPLPPGGSALAAPAAAPLVPRRLLGISLLLGFALITALVLLGVRRTEAPSPASARLPSLTAASPEAHDAVLRGRYFLSRGRPEDLRRSAGAFRQAVALDPRSAAAWAGLADALHLQVLFGAVPPREGYPPAEEAARQALALDDMLATTHATLGTILFRYHWDWSGAEAEMRRALELEPGSAAAHHDLAWLLLAARRFDEALTEIQAARDLEPLSVRANADVGWVYYRARRYDEAIRQMERTLEMEPRFLPARHCLERALLQVGRPEEALRHALESARQEGLDPAGLPADPRLALQRLTMLRLKHLIGRGSTVYVSPYALAALHAELGDREKALTALTRALEERDPMLVSLDVDPAFDAVRTDRRFQEIVARVSGPASRRPS